MEKQESNREKFGKLLQAVGNAWHDIKGTIDEQINESTQKEGLQCVQDGVLDYDLIEEDVKRIHQNLQLRGDTVLGTHLILDDPNNSMEIQTYTEMKGKTFLSKVKVEVKRITNIPEDVFDELKNNGRVKISLKI